MDIEKIIDSYNEYFYIVHANTENLRKFAYHIRYQVYCKEFKYEQEDNCPYQLEQDEYDAHSMHCVLVHKPSGLAAGCSRLIKPVRRKPSLLLPFELCCSKAVDKRKFDLTTVDRSDFGEVSRLAVLSEFRRRKSDEKKPISFPDQKKLVDSGRDNFPLISVSLSLGMAAMVLNSDVKYAFAMMEPRLTRMLRRFGIVFNQIGDVVNYHGQRGPFVIARENILLNLSPKIRPLMSVIDEELKTTCEKEGLTLRSPWIEKNTTTSLQKTDRNYG
jgi:N-acyl amino acid synthase of PEP-CTERM/exosortase system